MKQSKLWSASIIVLSIFGMIILSGITGADGNEGSGNGDSADSEEAGTAMALDETYDSMRAGARLLLAFDAQSNNFYGLVQNTTSVIMQHVRIEVHLSNGVELGPTTPIDLDPGDVACVLLLATDEPFDSWSAHAEVGVNSGETGHEGDGEGSGENGGEHGEGNGD